MGIFKVNPYENSLFKGKNRLRWEGLNVMDINGRDTNAILQLEAQL